MTKGGGSAIVLALLLSASASAHVNTPPTETAASIDDRAERIIALAEGDDGLVSLDDAIALLSRGINQYPNDGQLYVSLALAYDIKSDQDAGEADTQRDQALSNAALAHALHIAPHLASAYVFRASRDYAERGCTPCAEADLAQAAKYQDRPFLHVIRSLIARDRGDYKAAEHELLTALTIPGRRPGDVAATYAHLAYLYAYDLRIPDRADWAFRHGIAALPDMASTHEEYAYFLLFTRGDVEGAIREAQAARALKDPHGTRAYATALYARWAKAYKIDPKGSATQADWAAAMQIMPADGRLVAYMSDSITMAPTLDTLLRSGVIKGQDLNVLDDDNNPPLVAALSIAPWVPHHNASVVRALLEAGADPNFCGKSPTSIPLTEAVVQQDPTLVALLLRHEANVDPRHNLTTSPLFSAFGYPKIFPLLAPKANAKDRALLVTLAKEEQNWQALDALGLHHLAAHIKNDFVVMADKHLPGAKAKTIAVLKAAHIPYQVRQGSVWIRGQDQARAQPLLVPIWSKYARSPAWHRPPEWSTAVMQPAESNL